jgi:hypothetical protein
MSIACQEAERNDRRNPLAARHALKTALAGTAEPRPAFSKTFECWALQRYLAIGGFATPPGHAQITRSHRVDSRKLSDGQDTESCGRGCFHAGALPYLGKAQQDIYRLERMNEKSLPAVQESAAK